MTPVNGGMWVSVSDYRALAAERDALKAATEWQLTNIKHDENIRILSDAKGKLFVGYFDGGAWYGVELTKGDMIYPLDPTHWQPLPTQATQAATERREDGVG